MKLNDIIKKMLDLCFKSAPQSTVNTSHIAGSTHHNHSKKIPKSTITNTSPFADNMNYFHFSYYGIFSQTNRKRKGTIYSFSEKEAIDSLVKDGFLRDSISLEKIPFRKPSEAQIALLNDLNIMLPANACLEDVSAIISFYSGDDSGCKDTIAPAALFSIADSMHIGVSYYSGLYYLLNKIYYNSDLKTRIALYIIFVKFSRDKSWDFGNFDHYIELSDLCLQDSSFMNSFKHNNYHKRIWSRSDFPSKVACYNFAITLI